MSMPQQSLPLAGIKVLDLSRVLAGPFCSMILADLGAEVLKVEQPGLGDETRSWGPPFGVDGSALYFHAINRNKSSVTLDLKDSKDKNILEQLIGRSDVLLENFRYSSKASLGLQSDDVLKLNPNIVIASIGAYGSGDEWRDKPGYDFLIQAISGLMSITGPSGEGSEAQPFKVGVAVVDVLTGLFTAVGILAELIGKAKGVTKQASVMEVSLFDVMMSSLVNIVHGVLNTGLEAKSHGNAHAHIVPYQAFSSKDGMICLAIGNDLQFQKLCQALHLPSLQEDPRFRHNEGRLQHRQILADLLGKVFMSQTSQYWLDILEAAAIPAAPVQGVREALDSQLAKDNGLIIQDSKGMRYVRNPIRLNSRILPLRKAAPLLGEDNKSVLASLSPEAGEEAQS